MLLQQFPTIKSLQTAFEAKKISAQELTQDCLATIEQQKKLNAWLAIDPEISLAQAKKADELRAAGQHTPLTGVPIGHKDVFVTRHWPTTAGSKMLQGYQSPFDATVVRQLEQAGAVGLGKLNCDEFAMGSDNQSSFYGGVLNPWDPNRIPGGSSGGSAAAVASGAILAATASDTGGSIRQPASFCGVSGIKPTYGVVSRYGLIAYASSLDQAGPIARHAQDLLPLLGAISSFDSHDPTSLEFCQDEANTGQRIQAQFDALHQQFATQGQTPLKGLKIGLLKEFSFAELDPQIAAAIEQALTQLEQLGAQRVEVSVPLSDKAPAAYYVISPAEASSNLARFDGVRFGHRADSYTDIHDMMARSRAEGFGTEVIRRILAGTYVLSEGHYETFFLQAQRVRQLILAQYQQALEQCDVILAPVTAELPRLLNQSLTKATESWQADRYTVGANLAGLPAMSLPCGFSHDQPALPIGMQLIGRHYHEGQLLAIADCFQSHSDWHQRTPEL